MLKAEIDDAPPILTGVERIGQGVVPGYFVKKLEQRRKVYQFYQLIQRILF